MMIVDVGPRCRRRVVANLLRTSLEEPDSHYCTVASSCSIEASCEPWKWGTADEGPTFSKVMVVIS